MLNYIICNIFEDYSFKQALVDGLPFAIEPSFPCSELKSQSLGKMKDLLPPQFGKLRQTGRTFQKYSFEHFMRCLSFFPGLLFESTPLA
jgi:hypothetical protein